MGTGRRSERHQAPASAPSFPRPLHARPCVGAPAARDPESPRPRLGPDAGLPPTRTVPSNPHPPGRAGRRQVHAPNGTGSGPTGRQAQAPEAMAVRPPAGRSPRPGDTTAPAPAGPGRLPRAPDKTLGWAGLRPQARWTRRVRLPRPPARSPRPPGPLRASLTLDGAAGDEEAGGPVRKALGRHGLHRSRTARARGLAARAPGRGRAGHVPPLPGGGAWSGAGRMRRPPDPALGPAPLCPGSLPGQPAPRPPRPPAEPRAWRQGREEVPKV